MGKKRAKEHYDFIREQYHKEIDNSIANTTIHSCESAETRIPQYQNNYSVTPKDSVSCLFSLENKDNVAVLNFASYKKPTRELRNMFAALETKSCVKPCWIELILC